MKMTKIAKFITLWRLLTLSDLGLHFEQSFDLRLNPLLGGDVHVAIVRTQQRKGLLAYFHLVILSTIKNYDKKLAI